jgi:vitamin B12/bleomycin/antimicrobial peptide transport system ATP-binding/permease protein
VAGVDFSVGRGEKVIIVGPSGCGKSSLVRAISGLWQRGSGTVVWDDSLRTSSTQAPSSLSSPSSSSSEEAAEVLTEMVKHQDSAPSGVFFLPQKPYNLMGSLRLQITYPAMQDDKAATAPDAKLLDILDRVRLGGLAAQVGGLDAVEDWSKVLSLGEQQRLAFARVLYNRPMVVVLDESTSALDLASEEAMYRLLTNDLQATYISIGHRPSLLKYHDIKLVLGGPGQPVVRVPVTDTAAATLIDS